MREYNPTWSRIGLWQKLCDGWNTDAWRRISESGSINRNSIVDGSVSKHTCGSITIEQTRKNMKKKLGHEPSWTVVYSRTHTKRSKSGKESGEIQPVFITDRSRNFHGAMLNCGSEQCTGGKKKGRVFGVGNSDPCFAVTGNTPYGCGSSSHDYAQSQQELRDLREVLEDNRQELEQYRKEREEHQLELEQSRKEREESEARIQETIADLYRKLGQNIAPPPDGGL